MSESRMKENFLAGEESLPRLIGWRRLDDITAPLNRYPIVLVLGPGGCGKTTCISHWANTVRETEVLWIRTKPSHNDPATLMISLYKASRGLAMSADPGRIDRVSEVVLPANRARLLSEIRRRFIAMRRRVAIVVDDVHLLEEQASLRILEDLILELEGVVTFVLISRSEPPIRLSRMAVGNKVLRIGADALLIRSDEIRKFLTSRRSVSPELADQVATELHKKSGGWAFAVNSFFQAMDSVGDIEGKIARFGGKEFISSYVEEEILPRFEDEFLRDLMTTAIPASFSLELARELIQTSDVEGFLKRVVREGMVNAVRDRAQVYYEYHEFLRQMLCDGLRRTDPNLEVRTHQLVANWCVDNNQPLSAFDHLIEAGEDDSAATILEGMAASLIRTLQLTNFYHRIGRLPEETVIRYDALSYLYVGFLVTRGEISKARAIIGHLDAEKPFVILLQALVACYDFDADVIDALLRKAEEQGGVADPDSHSFHALLSGHTCMIRGEVGEAIYHYRRSADSARSNENYFLGMKALFCLSQAYLDLGNIDAAMEAAKQLARVESAVSFLSPGPVSIVSRLLSLGVDFERNPSVDSYDAFTTLIEGWMEGDGEFYMWGVMTTTKARMEYALGLYENVVETIDLFEAVMAERNMPGWAFLPLISYRVDALIRLQRTHEAEAVLDASALADRPMTSLNSRLSISGVTLRFILGDPGLAVQEAESLIEHFDAIGAKPLQTTTELRAAEFADRLGDARKASLLRKAARRRIAQFELRSVALAENHGGNREVAHSEFLPLPDRLTPRQSEILELLDSSFSILDISEILGISYSTVRSHLKQIYQKLDVSSRLEAIEVRRVLSIPAKS